MIKNTFLGHFSVTRLTHSQTHGLTDTRKVGVIELHVAAKKKEKNSIPWSPDKILYRPFSVCNKSSYSMAMTSLGVDKS